MNIRHHVLSTLVASSLVLTAALPALAAEPAGTAAASQDAKQAVIEKVRALFGGLADLPDSSADFSTDANVWEIGFAKGDPEQVRNDMYSGKPADYLTVVVDAKTFELRYLNQVRSGWGPQKNAPSESDAKRFADAFLKQVAPDLFASVQYEGVQRTGSPSSLAVYSQTVNGVPFPDSYVSVDVDEYGHVLFFANHLAHDLPPMPDKSKAVPLPQAQETFNQSLVIDKFYISHVPQADKPLGGSNTKSVLAYAPFYYPTLDAATGKLNGPLVEPPKAYTVTGEGWQTVADTPEVARNIAARLLGLDRSKMVLNGYTNGDVRTGQNWVLSWNTPNAYGVFDGANSDMLSIGRAPEQRSDAKPAFSLDDGKQKALNVLKHVLPTGENTIFLSSSIDNSETPTDVGEEKGMPQTDMTYTYLFNPSHQGVRLADLSYAVTIDSVTGAVYNVTIPRSAPTTLPDNKDTVPLDAVTATFLKSHPLRLAYSGEFGPQGMQDVKLVYSISSPAYQFAFLDAFTGKEVFFDGSEK